MMIIIFKNGVMFYTVKKSLEIIANLRNGQAFISICPSNL
jgi:hypothetical protein